MIQKLIKLHECDTRSSNLKALYVPNSEGATRRVNEIVVQILENVLRHVKLLAKQGSTIELSYAIDDTVSGPADRTKVEFNIAFEGNAEIAK